jgi:hypothetical protein
MGAALAGLVSGFPQLIWLSEHKVWVFAVSGILLVVSGVALYRSKDLPCPVDPKLREACLFGRKISISIFILTVICFCVGLLFAFIAPRIF